MNSPNVLSATLTAASIPDAWDSVTIGDIASKVGSGITPPGGSQVYGYSGRPFVRSQNVGWGTLLLDDMAFISETIHATFVNTELRLNDVLLNITGASIGRSGVAQSSIVGGNVNQHVCIIRTQHSAADPLFVNCCLLSPPGQRQIVAFQAGDNRQGLNFQHVRSIRIPLPPLHEQRAIATALTDVDDLLTSLDRLIAKKRAIKQGVMHDLLTGRKRLPGFGGKWREVSIGELANVDPEVLPQATDPNYEFNYIALEDVTRGTLRSFQRLRFATAPSRARRILRYHDILIGTVRPNLQSHLLHVRR
ncbi:MAG: restriction endonuclease subunit S, partial [Actinobacteria bacterium]|nr:restriction endonuclease subunit S [Actinomycetota bacterium]